MSERPYSFKASTTILPPVELSYLHGVKLVKIWKGRQPHTGCIICKQFFKIALTSTRAETVQPKLWRTE